MSERTPEAIRMEIAAERQDDHGDDQKRQPQGKGLAEPRCGRRKGEPDPVDDQDCGHPTKCTCHSERRRLLLPLGFRELDVELSESLKTPSDGARTCSEAEHREDPTRRSFVEETMTADVGALLSLWPGTERPALVRAHLYVNAWFPSSLAGGSPASDQSTLVDWITYSAR